MARHPAPNPAASDPAASKSADCIVDFDAPDLAVQIEKLRPAERDRLPFGVIELDREGQVLIYNATEASLSGYGTTPLGQNFFEVARSANKGDLELRVMRAMEEWPVDFELGWLGGYGASKRELRLRVVSSNRGGVWIFVERDAGTPAHQG
jgi:photoactive yellow protein